MSTATTWNSVGSTDANLAGNYSAGLPADAVVTLNNTSVINWIFTANMSIESITIAATYTGVVTMTGFTLTCSLGFSDDGITGAHTYGTSITCNGASSTFHIGAGVASVTATATTVYMNGTTGMVFDDDKSVSFKVLNLGASAVVTVSGAQPSQFTNTSNALVITNGGTLTINTSVYLNITTGSTAYSITGAPTINGTATLFVSADLDASTISIPAITMTGTVAMYLYNNLVHATISLSGNISIGGGMQIPNTRAGKTLTFYGNNFNITCTTLNTGSQNATATTTLNYGSGVYTITSLTGASNLGTTNENFQTSQFTCSGNWVFGSNHTVSPGTSIVTITNTATITSNGKSFYDFTVNAAAKTITMADALICTTGGDLTLTAGTLNTSTFAVTVGANFAVNGTTLTLVLGRRCR